MVLNLNEFKTRMTELEKGNIKSESVTIASKFLEHFEVIFLSFFDKFNKIKLETINSRRLNFVGSFQKLTRSLTPLMDQ